MSHDIYLKAKSSLGQSQATLPLIVKVSKVAKIQEIINVAPVFLKGLNDVELILNQSMQSYEIELPPVADQNGDNFTIQVQNLPKEAKLENSKIYLKDISKSNVYNPKIILEDSNGKQNVYQFQIKITKIE